MGKLWSEKTKIGCTADCEIMLASDLHEYALDNAAPELKIDASGNHGSLEDDATLGESHALGSPYEDDNTLIESQPHDHGSLKGDYTTLIELHSQGSNQGEGGKRRSH